MQSLLHSLEGHALKRPLHMPVRHMEMGHMKFSIQQRMTVEIQNQICLMEDLIRLVLLSLVLTHCLETISLQTIL